MLPYLFYDSIIYPADDLNFNFKYKKADKNIVILLSAYYLGCLAKSQNLIKFCTDCLFITLL